MEAKKELQNAEAKKELQNAEDPGRDYVDSHEGLPIILIRKNTPKRQKEEREIMTF